MSTSDRNQQLDIIKGIACILMLLAHNTIVVSPAARKVQFVGGLAPVFFFAVSGIILANYQIGRKKPWELLVYYFLFFFLGLSYNGVWYVRDNGGFWTSDIFQIIALASVLLVLLSRRVEITKLAWLFPVPFLIHLAGPLLPAFPLKLFFFKPPGVFPLFPWLAFFLFGILCHRFRGVQINLMFKVILAGLLVSGLYFGMGYGIKWNMNPAYFVVSCAVFAAVYFLSDWFKFLPFQRQLIFLGKNSLLFLYVHLFARDLVNPYLSGNLPVWAATLLLSLLLMELLIQVNSRLKLPAALQQIVWPVILLLIPAIPLFPHWISYIVTYSTGFYIAMNYGKLAPLIKSMAYQGEMDSGMSVNMR